MPGRRHLFGRGFWNRGYRGFPFPGGRGRGRARSFYPPVTPIMAGNWAQPYVSSFPPVQPFCHRRGYYPPIYSGYGHIAPVAPHLF